MGVILLMKAFPEYRDARKLNRGPTLHLGIILYPTMGLPPICSTLRPDCPEKPKFKPPPYQILLARTLGSLVGCFWYFKPELACPFSIKIFNVINRPVAKHFNVCIGFDLVFFFVAVPVLFHKRLYFAASFEKQMWNKFIGLSL
jgi:hypothetical protein